MRSALVLAGPVAAVLLAVAFDDSPVVLAAVVLAAFALGRFASPPTIVTAGALLAAGLTGAAALHADRQYTAADDFVWFAMAEVGMPALLGRLLALRGERAARLRLRGEALARERDRRAALAESEERVRLSAGVQSAVAQRLGEIALQAAGAARLESVEPQRSLAALARIEATARATLVELRAVLGWLRHSDAPAVADPEPPVAPRARSGADVLVAAVLGLAFAIEVAGADYQRGGWLANAGLVALTVVPLAWRRRAPLAVAVSVLAGMGVMNAFATPLAPLVTPVALVGLLPFTIGAHLSLRTSIAGLALALGGSVVIELLAPAPVRASGSLAPVGAVVLCAWAAGRWVRRHDDRLAIATQEIARLAGERDVADRVAVVRERTRVARELHDVIAHAMTAIVLQSGAAQRVWHTDPGAAHNAEVAVGTVAREALGHLREVLPALGPSLSRDDLHLLASQARASGLDVSLADEAPAAPPAVEAAAYRTVQEALTNAARHASGSRVAITLRAQERDLLVEVRDDGGAGARAVGGSGHGLVGMRERIEACGGRLETGPRPEGGFLVRASLPL